MSVRQQEFVTVVHVLHFSDMSSSSLHCDASPENLPFEYCVAASVRLFDQQFLK